MYLTKGCVPHSEILSSLLAAPGLQIKPFPPICAGFLSPETMLHTVKLLKEQVLHSQLVSVFLFILICVPVPPPLRTLLLLEELLLMPHHLLSGVVGKVPSRIHPALNPETLPKQPLHI